MHKILKQAKALKDWSVTHRRHLHQYPELSLQEKNTASYCKKILTEMGYEIKQSWGEGFTADLRVNDSFKTIAIRADMDALPIQEKNTHDFVSKNEGAAHMCGHDTHMTIALTTAKLLSKNKPALKNNVRFIFQPSEELMPGGAPGMIEKGCLEGVAEVYGLHNDPGTQVGNIRLCEGAMMAAGDKFNLSIVGKGGHAARPHDCLDPIIAGANLVTQWQSQIARRINPAHPAVLSVTKFQSGDTFNVIPDAAELSGTIRTFYDEDRQLIQNLMQDALLSLEKMGYQCHFNYTRGYDAVVNHAENVATLVKAATPIIGADAIDAKTEQVGWAEDFAYYLQHRPGTFFFLGSGNKDKNITAPLHSAQFDIDEDALAVGAAIFTKLLMKEV